MGELPVLIDLKNTIANGHAPTAPQAIEMFRRLSESIANGEKALSPREFKADGSSSARSEKVRPQRVMRSLACSRNSIATEFALHSA